MQKLSNALSKDDISRARERLLKMHYESGVGHIGGNLSALDCLMVLFSETMTDNDRFILSKGHSAGALYVSLWAAGKLSDEQLKTFHKDGTLLSGHPPSHGIDDILFATGSLGHGLSLSCGLALARKLKKDVDSHVYCVTSDGEWQEGSTWEALIFAQHHRLGNLSVLIDVNGLQGFGSTEEVASMGKLWERASGFDVDVCVIDGHDIDAIREACNWRSAQAKLIFMKTTKGKGVDFMENRMEWHYLPLDSAHYERALAGLREESRK
jgi:transketolase